MQLKMIDKLPSKKRGVETTEMYNMLKEFADSDMVCAEVIGAMTHYKRINSAQASIINSIQRYRFVGIEAKVRNGHVYLIKAKENEHE